MAELQTEIEGLKSRLARAELAIYALGGVSVLLFALVCCVAIGVTPS